MDQVKVNVPRQAPPDWARPTQAHPGQDGTRMATQPQLNFIRDLIDRKDLSPLTEEERKALTTIRQEETFWVDKTTRLTFDKARRILDKMVKLKDAPKAEGAKTDTMADRFAVGVPAGRYAVENEQGELRFYNVWVSRDRKRLNVYVLHGPDESNLKYQKTVLGVLQKIKAAGVRECAIRYGMEIGHCSNCGYRLTNRISRELGIGPVCGGRMFGDDFKLEVKAKRKELKAQGINPDEKLED